MFLFDLALDEKLQKLHQSMHPCICVRDILEQSIMCCDGWVLHVHKTHYCFQKGQSVM